MSLESSYFGFGQWLEIINDLWEIFYRGQDGQVVKHGFILVLPIFSVQSLPRIHMTMVYLANFD